MDELDDLDHVDSLDSLGAKVSAIEEDKEIKLTLYDEP